MTVLVTGGAGYMGSQLVPALLQEGHRVRIADSLVFGAHGLEAVKDRVELIPVDIRDMQQEHLAGVDALIHLAGISNDPTAEFDPEMNEQVNYRATVRLAELARKNNISRFIFSSSCSVYYSDNPDDHFRDENYPVQPTAPYSWSKRQAELQLLKMAGADFCPVLLRKGTIFGYSPRMRFDLAVNTFTRDAFATGNLNVHGKGLMWRPLLDIDDAVNVYKAMLRMPERKLNGQIFNVLSGNYQVIEIARRVKQILESRRRTRINIIGDGNSRSYRASDEKLSRLLGLRFNGSIEPAVLRIWQMLEEGIDFTNDIYYNIRWIESMQEKNQLVTT